MRLQLISLALTLGTLAWTDSAQQDSLVGYETISLQLRREPGLTTGVAALERRSQTHYKREDCDQKYKKWEWHPPWLHRRKGGGNDDGEDDDDCKCKDNKGEDIPCPSNPLSIPFITPVITTVITTEIVAPTTPSTIPPSSTTVSNSLLASSGTTSEPSSTSATAAEDQQDNDSHHGNDKNKGGDDNWKVIVGVLFPLLFLLVLSLFGYWAVIRPRRRNRLNQQSMGGSAKDPDLESHVTVDLRIQTPRSGPHDPTSSSDALSGYTVNIAGAGNPPGTGRPMFESAAASVSMSTPPGSAHARMHPATQRTPNGPSPTMSHDSLRDIDEAQRWAHGEARQPQTYAQMGRSQGPVSAPIFPQLPPPLQICAPPIHSSNLENHPAAEVDYRPPPPRYPEATATSPASCDLSPISPIIVSPLSMSSPHRASVQAHSNPNEAPYRPQQQQQDTKGPQQPSYEGYRPSTLPEVVSPICQLGQTSASLPEYNESAETAREGDQNNHRSFASRNPDHDEVEKQAEQPPMPRY